MTTGRMLAATGVLLCYCAVYRPYQPLQCLHLLSLQVYDNCRMLAATGELLCYCDARKLQWYLDKGLAELVVEEPPTIRLLFEHKNADQQVCGCEGGGACAAVAVLSHGKKVMYVADRAPTQLTPSCNLMFAHACCLSRLPLHLHLR
jgi:hypothetical protein